MTISRWRQPAGGNEPADFFSSDQSTLRFNTETFGSDSVGRSCAAPAGPRTVKGGTAMARDLLYELRIETTVRRERCGELDRERLQSLMVQDPPRRETEVSEAIPTFKSHPLNTFHL
ncbi:hypothetical protein L2Y90_24815 [Burkholderia pyrrocinia]|uniref:hypothetical protein n=1 Tax=Burkholderia pyrrocinia TaxID=60550 RepID=UPI00215B1313|nr:hypothetical protein [Burkholderia pyrrocinia]UVE67361.1 hypothetical protein L2Y90_24815 [Burkholderia pyrrocinia]